MSSFSRKYFRQTAIEKCTLQSKRLKMKVKRMGKNGICKRTWHCDDTIIGVVSFQIDFAMIQQTLRGFLQLARPRLVPCPAVLAGVDWGQAWQCSSDDRLWGDRLPGKLCLWKGHVLTLLRAAALCAHCHGVLITSHPHYRARHEF